MMAGFKSRLAQELKSLLSLPKYAGIKISQFKLHQPPAQPNLTTWLGQLLKDENMNLKPVLRSRSRLEPPFLGWSRSRFLLLAGAESLKKATPAPGVSFWQAK